MKRLKIKPIQPPKAGASSYFNRNQGKSLHTFDWGEVDDDLRIKLFQTITGKSKHLTGTLQGSCDSLALNKFRYQGSANAEEIAQIIILSFAEHDMDVVDYRVRVNLDYLDGDIGQDPHDNYQEGDMEYEIIIYQYVS